MKQLAGTERKLVWIAAGAAIAFAYLLVVVLPMNGTVADLEGQRIALDGSLERADQMYSSAQRAEGDIAALREEIAAAVFSETDVSVGMVRRLERLAQETKLTLTSIRPDDPETVDGITRYPATFKVEAEFAELIDLMFRLEQPDARLWVEGVEISAARREGEKLQATFYIAVYGKSPGGAPQEDANAAA